MVLYHLHLTGLKFSVIFSFGMSSLWIGLIGYMWLQGGLWVLG
jgi:hypothetical protein